MAKKTGFSDIFPAFSGGKNMFFENRAPSYFSVLPFCISVQNFMKKYDYSSRNSRNTVFPAKIGCSDDFKKVPATKISLIAK